MKIKLTESDFVDAPSFSSALHFEGNDVLTATYHENYQTQVMPLLYLFPNDHFQTDQNLAVSGLMLKVVSTTGFVAFALELYGSPFAQDYRYLNNKFYTFLKVERSNILGFEKKGVINFKAVKIKVSLAFAGRLKERVVPGGLLPKLLVGGALKLTEKAENESVEKDGVLYSLRFTEEGVEKTIDIIAEGIVVAFFEHMLANHWTKEVPVMKTPEKAKEGCFIATACYGDYDHRDVLVLRRFRDEVLANFAFGKKAIKIYYKFSPSLANKIEANNQAKKYVRNLMITPIVRLVSLFSVL